MANFLENTMTGLGSWAGGIDWSNAGAGLNIFGGIMGLIGNRASGQAAKRAGQAQAVEQQFEATQLEQNATAAIAAGTRDLAAEQLRTDLLVSRGVAVAAASGGSVTDPTVAKLLSDLSGQGAYRGAMALYQGEERARQLNMAAMGKRYEAGLSIQAGEDKQFAYNMKGMGELGQVANTLFTKYGNGGFKRAPVEDRSVSSALTTKWGPALASGFDE
jgi:hypothetical protein